MILSGIAIIGLVIITIALIVAGDAELIRSYFSILIVAIGSLANDKVAFLWKQGNGQK